MFDINPHPSRSKLRSTTVDFRQSLVPNEEKANLLAVAPHFGLRLDDAAAAFEHIAETVRTNWRTTARANLVPEAELRRFEAALDR